MPVLPVIGAGVGSAILPLGVVAYAGYADKQVHVAHHFAQHQGRDFDQGDGVVVGVTDPDLIGGHVVPDAGVVEAVAVVDDLIDPELRLQPVSR